MGGVSRVTGYPPIGGGPQLRVELRVCGMCGNCEIEKRVRSAIEELERSLAGDLEALSPEERKRVARRLRGYAAELERRATEGEGDFGVAEE